MSVGYVAPIAWDALKTYIVDPIKRGFRYVMSSKSFADDLREEVRNLKKDAARVQILEIEANNNVRTFHITFTDWKARVEKDSREVQELLDAFEEESKTCCHGTLPDPKCRYQFSRKAEGKIKVIKQLAQECGGFRVVNDICFINPAPRTIAEPYPARGEGKDVVQSTTATASVYSASTSIKLRDDGVFGSRAMIIRDVMDALAHDSNSVVGIYGMGGVGKSTLLEEVKRIISKEKFDWVAKANVSENPDIKTIQGEIADGLSLGDIKEKETVSGRAALLHSRLEKDEMAKKKVLIILDNLWKGLDLKLVGIPCGPGNKVKGCKLLLTSRDQRVLVGEMGCDKAFPLGGLEKEEAKILFERIVGDKVHEDPSFESSVDEALDKCAGLPLLIDAMAKHFKTASLSEWRDALRQIEGCTNDGVSAVINKMLQLSYDHLKSEDAKSLLQLCVTYGISEPSLENLLRYGYGLGIFQKNSCIKEARDRLTALIGTLQASSLLLDSGGAHSFKIHDLVCDFVARFVLKNQPLLLLKNKDMVATHLSKESLKSCMAICFPYTDIKELPQELDCPELRTFLLFTSNYSLEIPDSYFNSMKKLAVLNLTGISLTCSQRPFQFLDNLHTLCLQSCSLEDVATLGKLTGLQILSLANSKIQQLPKEIGQLVELRLLDLNYCSNLRTIEPGVLGNLIRLEELYMENSFDQWNAMEQTPPTNASLTELNNMNNLCTLHVSIPNPSVLPEGLDIEKLTEFKIKIGKPRYRWSNYRGSRTLKLKSSSVLRKGCIQSILSKIDDLFLEDLNGSEQSICALSHKNFQELKHLEVVESPSVHYILQSRSHADFEKLESLLLNNLIRLEKICHGHISSKSFGALKVVRVESCDKLKVLFPPSVMRGLTQLEEIGVVGCTLMCGIVEVDDRGKLELPKLRILKLRDLPNVKCFSTERAASSSTTSDNHVGAPIAFFNGEQVSIPSLESLTMEGLPNLKDIWSNESPLELSNLQSIEVERCRYLSKVISYRSLMNLQKLRTLTVKNCVSVQEIFYLEGPSSSGNYTTLSELTTFPLEKLVVDDCNNLRFMFFPSMVKSLAELRDLKVRHCKKMEAIIIEEELLGQEIVETLAFPMLINLHLEQLESLICFFRGKSSREAQSHDLVHSRSTAFFNRKVSIPSLESLTMEGLPNLKEIWSDESPLELSNLQSIKIVWCRYLSKVISFRSLMNLQQLHTLIVKNCVSVQEIFYLEGPSGSGNYTTLSKLTAFPLEKLVVDDCDNLRFMFFPSTVKTFAQLRDLKVLHCKKMEVIIMEEEPLGLETSETLAFPMLTNLHLEWLESLICFSRGKSLQEAQSHDLVQPRSTALFNREVAFPSLEELIISDLGSIEMIWDSQVAADSFRSLKSLTVDECNRLKRIWHKEFHHKIKFHCLRSVKISGCVNLASLFLASVARDLTQLEELRINECGIVELIEKEEALAPKFDFPKLTFLKLKNLTELKCTYAGTHALHWPALKTLKVKGCDKVEILALQSENMTPLHKRPLFLIEKVAFPRLETLEIIDLDNLRFMFSPSVVKSLAQLRELTVSECNKMEAVITEEKGLELEIAETPASSMEIEVVFHQLKNIELDGLRELRCFSSGRYNLMFPLLKDVIVGRCPNMNLFSKGLINAPNLKRVQAVSKELSASTKLHNFWEGNLNATIENMFEEMVTFASIEEMWLSKIPELIGKWHSELNPIKSSWQLELLMVDECQSFVNVIPPKLMLVLDNLGTLLVYNCELLEEIFNLEGLEVMESTRVLPKLETLRLGYLPKLRQLWNKDLQGMLQFNSLTTLALYKCSNLRHAFAPSMVQCIASLQRLEIKECGQMEKVIAQDEEQGSAMEKITFVKLQRIKLKCLPNLTSFLSGKNHMLECPKLKVLTIDHCPKMRSLTRGPSLFTPQVQFPQLKKMVLSHIDDLREIWTKSLQETLTFDNIMKVKAQNCKSLENLFPYWVATSLNQLQELRLESCGIEEIVTSGDDTPHSNVAEVLFPELISLVLHDMSRLKSFCPNLFTLNWPLVNKLQVTHCDKLDKFSFAASVNSRTQRDDQWYLSDEDAHSSFGRAILQGCPNLERLLLIEKDIHMIEDGKFPNDIFGKPKAVTLACFHDENAVFPSRSFLERFQNLQSLEVFCSSFEDIFPDEELVDEGKHLVLESLRELKLNKLQNLKRIWREDSLVSKILQSIETFEVWDCPSLTTLFPTMASFQNLTELVVKNSSGLVYLVTVSTVTNLAHLTKMTIIGCERMKAIVEIDENEEGKVISFGKLELLTLQQLPSLECFSSTTSCSFRFPSLYLIKVEECPKMKIFSKGMVSTPQIISRGDDLNAVMQKLISYF